MKFTPAAYQRLMADFLIKHDRAMLLCSLGMRKTASTLLALNDLFADGAIRRALVIAPLRVARLTWINEVSKWDEFRWMKPETIVGQHPGKPALHTVNYDRLGEITSLAPYDVVVIDEISKLKNPSSVRGDHLRKMLAASPKIRRWGLTGTPRPNSIFELHAQIRMLDDGKRLSPSYNHFRATYGVPTDHNEYNWVPKPDAERKIYEKISDLCLTLRSSDYQDVPNMVVEDVEIPLPKDAHAHYRVLEKELVLLLQDSAIVARNPAVLVGKLLQVCSGAVYDEERNVVPIHHGKITALKKLLLEQCEGENCIIACAFIHERVRVLAALRAAYPAERIVDLSQFDGDIEKEWNSGAIRFLVAHPDSLSHGLNLQKGGRVVIWVSPIFSREKYDQLNGRVARDGQTETTKIFRILCSLTLEDAVVETLRVRGEGQSAMLELLSNWSKLGRVFK